MYLIHLYHNFTRNARTGDLKLYVSCLPEIINIVFGMNHLNHARWLVKYYDSLIKLPETHPEVYCIQISKMDGFFSIPTGLMLEQTINADACSQRFGITSMTNPISARQT